MGLAGGAHVKSNKTSNIEGFSILELWYLYTSVASKRQVHLNAMPKVKSCGIMYKRVARSMARRSPPVTLVVHGSSNFLEASDVGTADEGRELALSGCDVLLGRFKAVLEALLHDALELLVNLLRCP